MTIYQKLLYLDQYLLSNKVYFTEVFPISKRNYHLLMNEKLEPNEDFLSTVADFFDLKLTDITDEEIELPPFDSLHIKDLESFKQKTQQEKDSHVFNFSRTNQLLKSWKFLTKSLKTRLILSLAIIVLPLAAYSIYSVAVLAVDRNKTIQEYEHPVKSPEQLNIQDELQTTDRDHNPDAKYVITYVGTEVRMIKEINTSTDSFDCYLDVWFTFDQDQHKEMMKAYDPTIKEENYPLYYPSNFEMFRIGNGVIKPNPTHVVEPTHFEQVVDGVKHNYIYSRWNLVTTITKDFDSLRYPLESTSFEIYVSPQRDAEWIRYEPDNGTISTGELRSGLRSDFSCSDGFRPITLASKDFELGIHYTKSVNTNPAVDFEHTIRTELGITIRCNRTSIILFIQAFINLFAVTIWIIIGFYSATYNKEDALGMLGTGLFGAISSIVVGVSLLSDSATFSLITMINIFTLITIMIMTLECLNAKRVGLSKNAMKMAFYEVKMRVLFYTLTISTVIMFIILPLISYITFY
ncbi:MAG: hypothetical protein RSE56_02355 [Bacilli bacterium]